MLLYSITICAQNCHCLIKTMCPEMELQGWGIARSFKSQDLSDISLLPLGFGSFCFGVTGRQLRQCGCKVPLVFFHFLSWESSFRFSRSCILWSWTASEQISPVYSQNITPRKAQQPHSTWLLQPTSSAQQKWEGTEPESPSQADCCFSSWTGEVPLWVPGGLSSSSYWSAFFNRAATSREIGRAFAWFWTLGFLYVLPLFSATCCLGGVFVIIEVWYLCCFGVFFLSLCSLSQHAVERGGGLPPSLSFHMQSFMECSILGKGFSLPLLISSCSQGVCEI